MPLLEMTTQQPIDALLVLGRGISPEGVLTATNLERAEVAVDIANTLMPKVVAFSGAHSWVQALDGIAPPSEGAAMLAHASKRITNTLRSRTNFLAEEKSTSTVANMVYSRPLLELPKQAARLGILSDQQHFSAGRIQHLARLVFPGVEIVLFQIDRDDIPGSAQEEKLAALMTKIFMAGVRPGNESAIMRRQHLLEKANAIFRRIIQRGRTPQSPN